MKTRDIACALMVLGLVGLPLHSVTAQNLETRVDRLENAVADLQRRVGDAAGLDFTLRATLVIQEIQAALAILNNLLVPLTRVGDELIISGVNLRIVNGTNSTLSKNGLGNLIVGYNEPRSAADETKFGPNNRTGSHNIVVGTENNFSSFGGLVVGILSEISGQFASVSGGFNNTASGGSSSVSGGNDNTASGPSSSVSGGRNNTANGPGSSVIGGINNTASGPNASVSGGRNNTANASNASVSGGRFNTASGGSSSVSGGDTRSAPGQSDWAAGRLLEDF
jgi:hypothetical protein